ncbi:MAG: pentapeptide repeat-containing protein [Bryobacteraceae bacterium]
MAPHLPSGRLSANLTGANLRGVNLRGADLTASTIFGQPGRACLERLSR